jgi:hypothetical protein
LRAERKDKTTSNQQPSAQRNNQQPTTTCYRGSKPLFYV